jgi:hypothetical protein
VSTILAALGAKLLVLLWTLRAIVTDRSVSLVNCFLGAVIASGEGSEGLVLSEINLPLNDV